ncbi:sulfatase [Candidatus Binatia bacterium]|nr:sulfatase [Candidatus Binatia bacterium]
MSGRARRRRTTSTRNTPRAPRRRLLATLLLATLALGCSDAGTERPPNVVVFLTDDQGYGDVASYGASDIPTPSFDRLAAEGMRLTSFYSAPTCTPSRAMLLTGSYGQRVEAPAAYYPWSNDGMSPDEITIAEMLRARGYATGLVGKWHLGHRPPFLPTRQGFDEYFGIPYSNDMGRVNPLDLDIYPDLPLMEGEAVVETEPDQSQLVRRYTERAQDFIARHAEQPFFLEIAHAMAHWPIAASAGFRGVSQRGLYGDVIAELDWSMGRILDTLAAHGIDDRTLVLFVSDNGPWLVFGNHAGSAGPLREGKSTSFEGGVRVPAIVRWPGHVPAGTTSSAVLGLADVLPTIARITGAQLPSDRTLDGRDAWPVLSGADEAAFADRVWLVHRVGGLEAVRRGRWKLHLPHPYDTIVEPGVDGAIGRDARLQIGLALFDLESDLGETRDVAAGHPEVVAELLQIAEASRGDLGDVLTGRTGRGVRPAGLYEPDAAPAAAAAVRP